MIPDWFLDSPTVKRLPRFAPFVIRGVCGSQFSIARCSGGCNAYGHYYQYDPSRDELIREDVMQAWGKYCAQVAREKREARKAAQAALFPLVP